MMTLFSKCSPGIITAISPRTSRDAFTLFEIGLSLALVAFAVTSVLIILPSGIQAQQRARFALYAAAKAEEMVESFNTTHNNNPCCDSEAPSPWEVPVSRRSQAWDLEARLSSHRFGIMPLPLAIARRLDSDGDEIQRLLADGGYLYYSQPMATTNTHEASQVAPPSETQKLVFAVLGAAQQNAIHILPWKNWPYVAQYPSPPSHGQHLAIEIPSPDGTGHGPGRIAPTGPGQGASPEPNAGPGGRVYYWPRPQYTARRNAFSPWGRNRTDDDTMVNNSPTFCWEECAPTSGAIPGTDPDIRKVFDWTEPAATAGEEPLRYGFFPYACGMQLDMTRDNLEGCGLFGHAWEEPFDASWQHPPTYPGGEWPNRASCVRYVQAALWYAQRKGLGPDDGWDPTDPTATPGFPAVMRDNEKWRLVQAMRFLSHAATCLTRWFPYAGDADACLRDGVRIPRVTLDGEPGPEEFLITHRHVLHYHERCLKLAMTYAAALPYDWGAPRPLQRTIMTDFPLLQYDLFSPRLTGVIAGAPAPATAEQWRPVPAQPISNLGLSYSYPARDIDPAAVFGDAAHFDLAMPFAAEERCRELVFWAVDWRAFEDCETAPSAPVDASKYPFSAPRVGAGFTAPGYQRMHDIMIADQHQYAFRNPEKTMAFQRSITQLETGAELTGEFAPLGNTANMWGYEPHDQYMGWGAGGDDGATRGMKCFSGAYGADRNYDRRLDRGPLPASLRLRAATVARFNFYDPRVSAVLR